MQKQLSIVAQAAREGDRAGAIYKAHQSLENDLAKFVSLAEFAINGQKTSNNFDHWEELKVQVEQVNLDVSVCLRLFSEHRVMLSSKGCESVERLYKQNKDSSERILSFLDLIKEKLGGTLSPTIVFAAGKCLQRINPEAAGFFVHSFITSSVNPCEHDIRDAVHAHIMECVLGSHNMLRKVIPSLLSLEVECFVASESTTHSLDSELNKFREWISDEVAKKLIAYEATCKQRCVENNAQMMEKKKHESLVMSKKVSVEKKNYESTQKPANSPSEPTNVKAGTALRTPREWLLNPFSLNGWKLQASRTATVLVGIILVKLLFTMILKLFKNAASALRSAPRRQRQLML